MGFFTTPTEEKEDEPQTRLEKLRKILENLNQKLKNVKQQRTREAEEKIVHRLEELNQRSSGSDLNKKYLDGKIKVKIRRSITYGGEVKRKYYTVWYYPKKTDSNRQKVFDYAKKELDSYNPETVMYVYMKEWNNWEKTLEQVLINQVEEEIENVKEDIKEKFNASPD